MAKQTLLIVDADTKSLRVLEVSLKKAGFSVTTAGNGSDALDKVAASSPDLIISDTRMPVMDGFAFCQKLKENPAWVDIPFIFLTKERELRDKVRGLELGVEDYLTKPIYIKEIVTRVSILLQKKQRQSLTDPGLRSGAVARTKFSGELADMGVVDLIQTIEVSRKTGVIAVTGRKGELGAIYFRDGRVIDAELGHLVGAAAVYRLLVWTDGVFEAEFKGIERRQTIDLSSQGLLMEGLRRVDEWGRLCEQLPPLDAIYEVDYEVLAERLAELPDELNQLLRLFDGRRSLLQVVDAAGVDDLLTLGTIARLHFDGLIVDRRAAGQRGGEAATARRRDWPAAGEAFAQDAPASPAGWPGSNHRRDAEEESSGAGQWLEDDRGTAPEGTVHGGADGGAPEPEVAAQGGEETEHDGVEEKRSAPAGWAHVAEDGDRAAGPTGGPVEELGEDAPGAVRAGSGGQWKDAGPRGEIGTDTHDRRKGKGAGAGEKSRQGGDRDETREIAARPPVASREGPGQEWHRPGAERAVAPEKPLAVEHNVVPFQRAGQLATRASGSKASMRVVRHTAADDLGTVSGSTVSRHPAQQPEPVPPVLIEPALRRELEAAGMEAEPAEQGGSGGRGGQGSSEARELSAPRSRWGVYAAVAALGLAGAGGAWMWSTARPNAPGSGGEPGARSAASGRAAPGVAPGGGAAEPGTTTTPSERSSVGGGEPGKEVAGMGSAAAVRPTPAIGDAATGSAPGGAEAKERAGMVAAGGATGRAGGGAAGTAGAGGTTAGEAVGAAGTAGAGGTTAGEAAGAAGTAGAGGTTAGEAVGAAGTAGAGGTTAGEAVGAAGTVGSNGTTAAGAAAEPGAQAAGGAGAAQAGSYDALLRQGDLLYRQGHATKAAPLLEQALATRPNGDEALVLLARIHLDRDQPRKAAQYAARAAAANARNAQAFLIVGTSEQLLGHRVEAKSAYETYLKLAPRGKEASDIRHILLGL